MDEEPPEAAPRRSSVGGEGGGDHLDLQENEARTAGLGQEAGAVGDQCRPGARGGFAESAQEGASRGGGVVGVPEADSVGQAHGLGGVHPDLAPAEDVAGLPVGVAGAAIGGQVGARDTGRCRQIAGVARGDTFKGEGVGQDAHVSSGTGCQGDGVVIPAGGRVDLDESTEGQGRAGLVDPGEGVVGVDVAHHAFVGGHGGEWIAGLDPLRGGDRGGGESYGHERRRLRRREGLGWKGVEVSACGKR